MQDLSFRYMRRLEPLRVVARVKESQDGAPPSSSTLTRLVWSLFVRILHIFSVGYFPVLEPVSFKQGLTTANTPWQGYNPDSPSMYSTSIMRGLFPLLEAVKAPHSKLFTSAVC